MAGSIKEKDSAGKTTCQDVAASAEGAGREERIRELVGPMRLKNRPGKRIGEMGHVLCRGEKHRHVEILSRLGCRTASLRAASSDPRP